MPSTTDIEPRPIHRFLGSRRSLIVLCSLALLGFYLLITHTGHVLSALPYLLLMACPLMHLFHGRHRHGSGPKDT